MKYKYFTSSHYAKQTLSSNIVTMFSLNNPKRLLKVIQKYSKRIISVSLGMTKVAPRLRRLHRFMGLVIKYNKHHGTAFTIKWLKACHLAVQRKLSSRPCRSLRDIEPNLPCPRLINGLPVFIGTMDRKAIRQGHAPTIRLWLTILSIFRILKGPLNPKLETITNPFGGSLEELSKVLETSRLVYSHNKELFSSLKSIRVDDIAKLLTAGPNNPVSIQGLLTDAIALIKNPNILDLFRSYLIKTKSIMFLKQFDRRIEMIEEMIETKGSSWVKIPKSMSYEDIRLGKLSFKEEAAGKLRVFAIADAWTQSLFKPLHKSLFDILRRLPNDGTFDQDSSFQRCLQKAQLYNCAYSVDLSSATDRLPIVLQSGIIDILYQIPELGSIWAKILVDRPYVISKNKYKIPTGAVHYATGQPMGALSSWAMLAVTHHFILQVSALNVYPEYNSWYDRYEILGDDLVIFDTNVYQEYLRIMDLLDVGTNPSKSLFSEGVSAIEFAKRTGINGIDVSGISWKQFISALSLSDRIGLLIHFAQKGLVPAIPIIFSIIGAGKDHLTLDSLSHTEKGKSILNRSLMALLGHFVNSNKMSLVDAVAFTVDPHDKELGWLDDPTVPFTVTLHECLKIFKYSATDRWDGDSSQLSAFNERKELVENYLMKSIADDIVVDVLRQALLLKTSSQVSLNNLALSFVSSDTGLSVSKSPSGEIDIESDNSVFSLNEVKFLQDLAQWAIGYRANPIGFYEDLVKVMRLAYYPVESKKPLRVTLSSMWFARNLSKSLEKEQAYFKIESNSRVSTRSELAWLSKDIKSATSLTTRDLLTRCMASSNR